MDEDPRHDLREAAPWRVLAGLLGLYLAVGLIFAFTARSNIDEGMFLNAGHLVREGLVPYRDFPFSQAPALPFAYAAAPSLFGSPLLGGRAVSFGMALGGMGAALWLTRKLAGNLAAFATLCLALTNLHALWVSVTIRAQAIATPLLVLGAAALALPRRSAWSWATSPSLMLWASAVRMTNLGAFVLVAAWVVWQLRRSPGLLGRVAAILGAQALVILWPVILAPREAFFNVIAAQWTRAERLGGPSASFLASLQAKANVYWDLALDAPVQAFLFLGVVAALVLVWRRGWRPDLARPMGDARSAQLTCVGLGLVTFLPHLALSHAFITYVHPLWALVIPAVGIELGRRLEPGARHRPLAAAVAVALLALASTNALANRDIWVGSGGESFAEFRRLADELGALGGPDCTVLTFQTNLAVEAGCEVLPGLEYSFFSYFAGIPDDEAERLGVVNGALLRSRVATLRPELIALTPQNLQVLRAEAERTGMLSPRRSGAGAAGFGEQPLDALGEVGAAYAFRGRYEFSNGAGSGTEPLLVFTLPAGASSLVPGEPDPGR